MSSGARTAGPGGSARITELQLGGLLTAPDRPWPVELPERNFRECAVGGDLLGGRLRLALRLGRNPGGSAVRLSVYVVNKRGWFYKSARDYLLTHRQGVEVELDLSPDSADMVPAGSARPWSEEAGVGLSRVGLALFATAGYVGPVEVSVAAIDGGSADAVMTLAPPAAEGLEVVPVSPAAGEMVELGFRFPVVFANPFDPDVADISARVTGPDGTEVLAPAYHDQDFALAREGFELRALPVGPGRWKARFTPRSAGQHRVELVWRGAVFGGCTVTALPPGSRTSAGTEGRPDGEALERLATVAGETFLRRLPADPGRARAVWRAGRFETADPERGPLAGWIAPLEWTAEWGSWMGLGRYNLELAWKLDLVLARAARAGVRRPLLLNFDGMFMAGGRHPLDRSEDYGGSHLQSGQYRWAFNPLSAMQGGPLAGPGAYYLDRAAEKSSRTLFRYLAARYGQHPAVEELTLAASFPAEGVAGWHARVGGYVAACCSDGRAGPALASLHPQAVEMTRTTLIGNFEQRPRPGESGWKLDKTASPGAAIDPGQPYTSAVMSEGRFSLRVEGDFPGEVLCLLREIDADWWNAQQLSFDAYLPPETPGSLHVRVQAVLRDRELNWYEALLPGELRRGEWTKFLLDLRPGRSALAPVPSGAAGAGALRPWDDYSRQRVRVVALRFYAWSEAGAGATASTASTAAQPAHEPESGNGAGRQGAASGQPAPAAVYRGPVFLDNIRLCGTPAAAPAEPELQLLDLVADNADRPETFTRVEYTFRLSRSFANPYDPECVDVRALVMTPGGQVMTVPGFFYQGYSRHRLDKLEVLDHLERRQELSVPEGVEALEPDGGSVWKLRLSAAEAGRHLVEIQVLVPDGAGGARVALRRKGLEFDAVRGARRGHIRVARDGRHFEHSGGEFFYPLGMAIRSPSDARDLSRDDRIAKAIRGKAPVLTWLESGHAEYLDLVHARGTYQFDDYFAKCREAGMNWARVWMCPWWLGMEWDHRYPGYEGAGRYNQANAWRMDHVIEEAEKNGIYLQICLTNHGQVSSRIDREWDFHPYRRRMPLRLHKLPDRPSAEPEASQPERPGGFLEYPRDYFLDRRAKQLTRNRLRYIVARWSYSTSVMGYELMSEVEFTGGTDFESDRNWDHRRMPAQADWHGEIAQYLRSVDPYRHTITTHFSHPCNGSDVWNAPGLDYVQSNAYSSFTWLQDRSGRQGGANPQATIGAPAAVWDYYRRWMAQYRRPVLIGEWGGHWMKNDRDVLDAELHTGLWAQAATPMAGATGYWWWLHVHYNDRYSEFAALSRFLASEDLRGVTKTHDASVSGTPGRSDLEALAAGDGSGRAYAYVFSTRLLRSLEPKPQVSGAHLELGGLAADTYTVEYWDTWAGRPMGAPVTVTGAGGPLRLELPAFQGDLAVKVRGAKARAPARPPEEPVRRDTPSAPRTEPAAGAPERTGR